MMENVTYDDLQEIEFNVKYSEEEKTWVATCKEWEVIKGIDNRRPQLALESLCNALMSVIKAL
jgi:hypothetical protein